MNLCSDSHDEVCYEGRECPACAVIYKMQDEINDLKTQIDDLQEKLDV